MLLVHILALKEMNSVCRVEDSCSQAIYDSGCMGTVEANTTTERTVAEWNILLRSNCEHFPLPDPKILKSKNPLPYLLEYYCEEIMFPWIGFCIENLAVITVELTRNKLVANIIPKRLTR